MNKKIIIIIALVGLMSFGGTFIVAKFTAKTAPPESPEVTQIPKIDQSAYPATKFVPTAITPPVASGTAFAPEKTMTKTQLKDLIFEIQEKIEQYNSKLIELDLREQRVQLTEEMLKEDVEKLDNLRIELVTVVSSIKGERDKLLKSRVEIAEAEKNNLISIAAAYDKMESASASKILTNISKSPGDSADDAVKILHYMTERTKAKLLAELATSEPRLAAFFCKRLKQINVKE